MARGHTDPWLRWIEQSGDLEVIEATIAKLEEFPEEDFPPDLRKELKRKWKEALKKTHLHSRLQIEWQLKQAAGGHGEMLPGQEDGPNDMGFPAGYPQQHHNPGFPGQPHPHGSYMRPPPQPHHQHQQPGGSGGYPSHNRPVHPPNPSFRAPNARPHPADRSQPAPQAAYTSGYHPPVLPPSHLRPPEPVQEPEGLGPDPDFLPDEDGGDPPEDGDSEDFRSSAPAAGTGRRTTVWFMGYSDTELTEEDEGTEPGDRMLLGAAPEDLPPPNGVETNRNEWAQVVCQLVKQKGPGKRRGPMEANNNILLQSAVLSIPRGTLRRGIGQSQSGITVAEDLKVQSILLKMPAPR